jgi:hypothetical protein
VTLLSAIEHYSNSKSKVPKILHRLNKNWLALLLFQSQPSKASARIKTLVEIAPKMISKMKTLGDASFYKMHYRIKIEKSCVRVCYIFASLGPTKGLHHYVAYNAKRLIGSR